MEPVSALAVAFSANDTLFDRLQRPIARQLYHSFPYGPLPPPIEPLATHGFLAARVIDPRTGRHRWAGVEAVPTGTRRFWLSAKAGQQLRLYRVECTAAQAAAAWVAACRDAKGHRPYDYIGLAVASAFCLWGQPDRFYESRHASIFCEEGVTLWLRAGTIAFLVFGEQVVPPDDALPCLAESWSAPRWPRLHIDGLTMPPSQPGGHSPRAA